jgi:hypothetical protein
MENSWITIDHIREQEAHVWHETEEFFGRERNGFSDFALDAIELILQGILYLRDVNDLNKGGEFKDVRHALRTFAFYHFYTTVFTSKAVYNLFHGGYYTEASILIRSIIESFVRLKYLNQKQDLELVMQAFAGHQGFEGEKYSVKYRTHFDEVAPGMYHYYQILCDMAHGSVASHVLKSDWSAKDPKEYRLDIGIVFKPEESTFVLNQFSVYLLAELEYMFHVFPEIGKKMPVEYKAKYTRVVATLRELIAQITKDPEKERWANAIRELLKI